MDKIIIDFFVTLGFSSFYAELLSFSILIVAFVLVGISINIITKKIMLPIIAKIVKKTKTQWDDVLLETGLAKRLVWIFPLLIMYFLNPIVFKHTELLEFFLQRVLLSGLIAVLLSAIASFITAINVIYSRYEISRHRPIKGFTQIIKVIVVIIGILLIISTLMNKSITGLLTGIGALSAVFMLVFKDSILGLVAAIQLSGNDMIRIGDWVSIPEHGADGDVIDIKLQTVTIQNWDKTLVNVPIYSLVSSSFKNWRGMSESGGRQIKRHITID
ncbi:MAG TPA: mechanosensitive ion channel domain-containing protein, partial [Treponemataceae bacterium]|nr:mechanosensitive ion channel domain-containing protein [Treponemataceae bacterium]